MNKPSETSTLNGNATSTVQAQPPTTGSISTYTKIDPLPASKPMSPAVTPPTTGQTATVSPLLAAKAGPATDPQKPS